MIRAALAGLAAVLTLAACGDDAGPALPYRTVPVTPFMGEAVMGDPAAKVEVVEYASTTCSHCKAFHDEVLPELKAKYIDTGKARLLYRVMPTPPVGLSMAGGALARCAGESKFFAMITDLFDSQGELIEATRQPRRLQRLLVSLGGRHGLSADEVGSCLADEKLTEHLIEIARDAPASVTGTPAFIVNGVDVEQNSLDALSAAIDSVLESPAPVTGAPTFLATGRR
jgi:protein-disulfide isomerase